MITNSNVITHIDAFFDNVQSCTKQKGVAITVEGQKVVDNE